MLRQQSEIRYATGMQSAFDIANGLPMKSDQFGEAFLGQARLKASDADVAADDAEHLGLGHIPMLRGAPSC